MVTVHNLGFPRIGENRELKTALEAYWRGESTVAELIQSTRALRARNWQDQASLNWVPVGDFSLYDHVLDMSVTLGNTPRSSNHNEAELDDYFRIARGRSRKSAANGDRSEHMGHDCGRAHAAEMTKWFDTNYHYIVPEFGAGSSFQLNPTRLIDEIDQARQAGHRVKPVVVGPASYLWLGKCRDNTFDRLQLLERLLPIYRQLLELLGAHGVEWVQMDEPALVTDLEPSWQAAVEKTYGALTGHGCKILLTTYFGPLEDNLELVVRLPVDGVHIDVSGGDKREAITLSERLPSAATLSLGVVSGRNVWTTDLSRCLDWLEPLHSRIGERLWLAPSCSLLHVPVDLSREANLDAELKSWLAFARQKLLELGLIARALTDGRDSVRHELANNALAVDERRRSPRVNSLLSLDGSALANRPGLGQRRSTYAVRAPKQAARLRLPQFPTTTIGSFPQTPEIRSVRHRYRKGDIDASTYTQAMRAAIRRTIREQEALGLDVLVHGEPERNDMVEYFGEHLEGYALTQHGWVQSYGSRCVKPPILYGDVRRRGPITVNWIQYAQSLTSRPVKGMLTGPVTLLNWSFVRDDQPRERTCEQLALAVREEVLDLESAGTAIIQIDEAALREGLPLRRARWHDYLQWAIGSFRIAAGGVRDETQIHTHMCYSDFNEILTAIANMDADVITIETARSEMELLSAFEDFNYPNQFGPGVYDIHSPNVPSEDAIVELMLQAIRRMPRERIWVNPDCGLKTRQWSEVVPALKNMVSAAKRLRASALAQPSYELEPL